MGGLIRYLSQATDRVPMPKSTATARALLAGIMSLSNKALPAALRMPEPKPERKCALPDCENVSTKAYCCAEHCLEHRRLDRERRSREA